MKITSIRTHILKSSLAQPFAQGLEAPEIAAAAAIKHALTPLLPGADPLDVEVLWHRMYHSSGDFGRKGSVIAAISAIDNALWDVAVKHIAALAQAQGIEVNPHVWGSAVAQASSLQVIASLPVTNFSLFAREPVLEYDRSSHLFRRELTTLPIELVDGMVKIPNGPGLGIEVVRDTLEQYRVN